MAPINQTIVMITLNVNRLNTSKKRQIIRLDFFEDPNTFSTVDTFYLFNSSRVDLQC